MVYFKNFRHQIILLVLVSFIALWEGGILVFNHHVNASLEREKQFKYSYDQQLITTYLNKLVREFELINLRLSGYLSENNVKQKDVKDKVMEFWRLHSFKDENIRLSYYDSQSNYNSITTDGTESLFNINDKLPLEIFNKYKNTLEGRSFTYCFQSCRLFFIKPAFDNQFNKGTFQLSYAFSDILNDLLRELPSNQLIIVRSIDRNNHYIEAASSIELHEKLRPNKEGSLKERIITVNNKKEELINFIKTPPYNDFSFIVIHNIKNLQEDFDQLYQNYYYTSTLILIIIIVVFILFLKIPIQRINHISSILKIIGEGHFNKAQNLLKISSRDKVYDELDMIHTTTSQLAGQLDNMHKSLMDSNQKLTDKVDEVTYLADHDSLTGLYNRRRFSEELNRIHQAGIPFCLASIDMDHFKLVNDSLGHHAGDVLLQTFSHILLDTSTSDTIVGRLGGDEFSLVIPEPDKQRLIAQFESIVDQVKKINISENSIIRAGASIGASLYPQDTTSLDELSSFSDAAMYENKRFKTASFNFYTGSETLIQEEKQAEYWNRILQEAMNKRTIKLLFQPVIEQHGEETLGYEVLSRIGHEEALMSPTLYIERLEKTKQIIQYDRLVFDLALEQASAILNKPRLMINLSYISMVSMGFYDYILNRVQYYGYPPHKIIFEITEHIKISNFDEVLLFISSLKKHGFSFSLDDFGEGFSSFFYLTQLPLEYLKIDKKIIQGLPNNPVDHHVMQSILLLAKSLDIKTIAEGIETKHLKDLMVDYEVEFLQGHHICRPIPACELNSVTKVSRYKYFAG